jgi:hypothetical protein
MNDRPRGRGPSSLSSQATEHSYVGSARKEDSPVNLAPDLRLMSQRGLHDAMVQLMLFK